MKDQETAAYTLALLRSLQFSGVKFVRYFALDACGNVRCKVRPVDSLLSKGTLKDQVAIAAVCFAGLPFYADSMIEGTGMTATHVLKVQPDLSSLRILPYAPKTALVMGNAFDQNTNNPSSYCTRGLLQRVLREAAEKCNTAFVSFLFVLA
jgi:glutamine synthetase